MRVAFCALGNNRRESPRSNVRSTSRLSAEKKQQRVQVVTRLSRMLRVFSIIYWLFFAVSASVFYFIAAAVYLLVLPFDRRRVVLHMILCAWGSFYIYCNPFWSIRTTGRSRLLWRGPAVMVANHASVIDILVLFSLYRPFKWVSKRSNFNLPVVGWVMWMCDYVPLVRGNKESVAKMMDHCAAHLEDGSALLLFPEGTRSPDGQLRAFKDGAFIIARQAGCPVIPIAIHGTEHVLPKHGFFFDRMKAHVEILEPIDSRRFDSMEALRDAAHDAIQEALASHPGEQHTGERVDDAARAPRMDRTGRAARGADPREPAASRSHPRTSALP